MFARVKRISQSWVRDRIIISIGFGACERERTHTRPASIIFQRHIRPCCAAARRNYPDCLFRVLIIAPLVGPITSRNVQNSTTHRRFWLIMMRPPVDFAHSRAHCTLPSFVLHAEISCNLSAVDTWSPAPRAVADLGDSRSPTPSECIHIYSHCFPFVTNCVSMNFYELWRTVLHYVLALA